jgi:glutathione peroxidase-family protein
MASATTFYDLSSKDKKGDQFSFKEELQGKVALIVNGNDQWQVNAGLHL